jgi:predicted ester cyclase
MSSTNHELVHRWFEEVWNKQREEAIDEMFAPEGKAYGFPEPHSVLVGPENFKQIHRAFLSAFPDLRITVNDIICENDRVAVTWTAVMTHLGDSLGFAPTSENVSLEGCSILVIRDSQIQDGWNYMELQGLVQRLKQMSAPSTEEETASLA